MIRLRTRPDPLLEQLIQEGKKYWSKTECRFYNMRQHTPDDSLELRWQQQRLIQRLRGELLSLYGLPCIVSLRVILESTIVDVTGEVVAFTAAMEALAREFKREVEQVIVPLCIREKHRATLYTCDFALVTTILEFPERVGSFAKVRK